VRFDAYRREINTRLERIALEVIERDAIATAYR